MVPINTKGRLPYDKKIEEKFQRKKAVPVDLEDLQHVEEEPLPAPSAQQARTRSYVAAICQSSTSDHRTIESRYTVTNR